MNPKADDMLLHQSTISLTKAASEMSKKIKNQSFIVEAISNETKINMNKFTDSTDAFDKAIDNLDSDKRNKLIVALLILIVVLMYYLKYQ